MWAYYAEDHHGIMIEYDIPDFLSGFTTDKNIENAIISPGDNKLLHLVNYNTDNVEFDYPVDPNDNNEFYTSYYQALVRKSIDWVGESEFRILIRNDSVYAEGIAAPINVGIIKSITFGCKIDRRSINKIIDNYKFKCECYHAVKIPGIPKLHRFKI